MQLSIRLRGALARRPGPVAVQHRRPCCLVACSQGQQPGHSRPKAAAAATAAAPAAAAPAAAAAAAPQFAAGPPRPRLGWATAALGGAGFCMVAFDVFAADSMHLLAAADSLGHLAAESLDPVVRRQVWGGLVSDAAKTIGFAGWAAVTLAVAFEPRDEVRRPAGTVVGLSWLLFGLSAGSVKGDPVLVATLKELFHRARPSAVHSTFSFPSGHTTSATFLVASLLFVLLPLTLASAPAAVAGSAPYSWMRRLSQASWPLLATAWATTALGRVLGDAHWFSDTLAAGFLSLAVTSALAMCAELVMEGRPGLEGGPASTDLAGPVDRLRGAPAAAQLAAVAGGEGQEDGSCYDDEGGGIEEGVSFPEPAVVVASARASQRGA